ncbi:MAG: hypothetical protein LBE31_05710, partial [Deltaproteobacteria bacterium]|nr:hypothetical protein [Deltaproteobacteria bacterium]
NDLIVPSDLPDEILRPKIAPQASLSQPGQFGQSGHVGVVSGDSGRVASRETNGVAGEVEIRDANGVAGEVSGRVANWVAGEVSGGDANGEARGLTSSLSSDNNHQNQSHEDLGLYWAGPVFGQANDSWPEPALKIVPRTVGLAQALSALEEGLIRRSLTMAQGVQSRAADTLGLRRNVFKYKWDKWAQLPPTPLSEKLSEVAPNGGDLVSILASMEEQMLRRALILTKGVQAKAADLLGLKRNVMPYKLKKYPALLAVTSEGPSDLDK